jgi:hypothetical protein
MHASRMRIISEYQVGPEFKYELALNHLYEPTDTSMSAIENTNRRAHFHLRSI